VRVCVFNRIRRVVYGGLREYNVSCRGLYFSLPTRARTSCCNFDIYIYIFVLTNLNFI